MAHKLFAFGSIFLILLSIVKNSSAHHWVDVVEQYYPQQAVPNYNHYYNTHYEPREYRQQAYTQQVVPTYTVNAAPVYTQQVRPFYTQQVRPTYSQQAMPAYTQQRPYQQGHTQQVYQNQNNQQQSTVSVAEAEWVCTNPNTNDMVSDGENNRITFMAQLINF